MASLSAITIFLMLCTLAVEGSITQCCEQGRKTGNKMQDGPICVEKNLNLGEVGNVDKVICTSVFKQCCKYSAMENNCKHGLQLAINGFNCEAGKHAGGEKKNECCKCCQEGLKAASLDGDCEKKQKDIMCTESFSACCKNAKANVKPSSAPLVVTTKKVVDCKTYGCQHECVKGNGGKLACKCKAGYKLKEDGKSCDDIDECSEGSANCVAGTVCKNNPGSFSCVKQEIKQKPCKYAGFKRNEKGVCVDIDECASGAAQCGDGQYCLNTQGYYSCLSNCLYGYKAIGNICHDIDECAIANPCPRNYKCVNTVGYYRCALTTCNAGFMLKNEQCIDIDECAEGIHNCGAKFTCKNTIGSFYCQRSACDKGFKLASGYCQDINECAETPSICGRGTCYNSYGSYGCSCFRGFFFNGKTKICQDIDECKRSPGICEAGCINTYGSYKCRCPAGYQSYGKYCGDIDECASSKTTCPANHVCANEFGSYVCINTTCPNKHYIHQSANECKLHCLGNNPACSNMVIKSVKWRNHKFTKTVEPRDFSFQYSLRVSAYLKVQIDFKLISGNEEKEFFLQRRSENTVDIINIKKLVGPKRYVLRLDTDVLFGGKVTSKFVYFLYLSLGKYNF